MSEYENIYICVGFFLANINTNLFGFYLLDEYEYKYIRFYQKCANLNMNSIIQTVIGKYKWANIL